MKTVKVAVVAAAFAFACGTFVQSAVAQSQATPLPGASVQLQSYDEVRDEFIKQRDSTIGALHAPKNHELLKDMDDSAREMEQLERDYASAKEAHLDQAVLDGIVTRYVGAMKVITDSARGILKDVQHSPGVPADLDSDKLQAKLASMDPTRYATESRALAAPLNAATGPLKEALMPALNVLSGVGFFFDLGLIMPDAQNVPDITTMDSVHKVAVAALDAKELSLRPAPVHYIGYGQDAPAAVEINNGDAIVPLAHFKSDPGLFDPAVSAQVRTTDGKPGDVFDTNLRVQRHDSDSIEVGRYIAKRSGDAEITWVGIDGKVRGRVVVHVK